MKRLAICVLIICLLLCGCQSSAYSKHFATADERVASFKNDYLSDQPFNIYTAKDYDTGTYTITIEAFREDSATQWLKRTYAADFNSLDSTRAKAALNIMLSKINQPDFVYPLFILLYLNLPLKDFEEAGITLLLQHKNRDGKITTITENTLIESMQ